MRISVIGLGYVGTVCAACLAERGHKVVGTDKAKAKVDAICSGRSPIIEREIDRLIQRNAKRGNLSATLDVAEAVVSTDISLVCVGTPSHANGALSLTAVETVATEIGLALKKKA